MILRRRRPDPVPEAWAEIAARRLREWELLTPSERERLGDLIASLLREKGWEAARGFALTDDVRVTIAANAALPLLDLDVTDYRDVASIVVHRTTVRVTGPHRGPVTGVMTDAPRTLLGQAHDNRGPVVLAWDAVLRDLRSPARGCNVVIHEFAHKLDMLDGLLDGTPLLADRAAHSRWVDVCGAAYESLRVGEGPISDVLREYGGTDPGEFFAVAVEGFFTIPVELADAAPEVYGELRTYFGQDPAARRRTRAESA